jgi:hypothetical protein
MKLLIATMFKGVPVTFKTQQRAPASANVAVPGSIL